MFFSPIYIYKERERALNLYILLYYAAPNRSTYKYMYDDFNCNSE